MRPIEERKERLRKRVRKINERNWRGWLLAYFKNCLFMFIGLLVLLHLQNNQSDNIPNCLVTAMIASIPLTWGSYRALVKMRKKTHGFKSLFKEDDKQNEEK